MFLWHDNIYAYEAELDLPAFCKYCRSKATRNFYFVSPSGLLYDRDQEYCCDNHNPLNKKKSKGDESIWMGGADTEFASE